jgi:hypothetical protein
VGDAQIDVGVRHRADQDERHGDRHGQASRDPDQA